MNIIAADDEFLQLEKLMDSIKAAVPEANLAGFSRVDDVREYAKENSVDIAFLDIQMRGATGLELAKELKEINPKINIVFVTSFEEYKGAAMDLRASGYIMKPVNEKKIKDELEDLRYPLPPAKKPVDKKLKVQCFGNFDIFDKEGNPVKFARKRSMELFAYLISKRGSRCTTQELISTLFYDDESETKKLNDRFQQAVTSLARGLRNIGAQDVLVRSFKNYAIDVNLVDCDYYHFLEGDMRAVNAYQGEFMNQYEWAEFIIGYLEEQKKIF